MKKILSIVMAMAMVLSMGAFAFAASTTDAEGNVDSQLTLDAQAARFSVTVPTKLPVQLSEAGVVTVATDAKIVNASSAQVRVSDIAVNGTAPWTKVAFTDEAAFRKMPVDAHKFAMKIGTTGNLQDANSALTAAGGIIGTAIDGSTAGTEFPFAYEALISPVSAAIGTYSTTISAGDTATGTAIASIVFTVEWVPAP